MNEFLRLVGRELRGRQKNTRRTALRELNSQDTLLAGARENLCSRIGEIFSENMKFILVARSLDFKMYGLSTEIREVNTNYYTFLQCKIFINGNK